MPVRHAEAHWDGDLLHGRGEMRPGHAGGGEYSVATRMQEHPGANPESFLGAAHAGCFSMAFAAALGKAGHRPEHVRTTADVHLDKDGERYTITRIHLRTRARVPGIGREDFHRIAQDAKANCPVSRALAGPAIELDAELEG